MNHTSGNTPNQWRCGTLTYTAAGLVLLFLWLMWGDFAYSMKDRATGAVAALMLKEFQVSDFLYGLIVISFPNFTNIFLCPMIAYRSDRHRGRFGRRIPYIFFTTPFIVFSLIGLGLTPFLARNLAPALGLSYHLTGLLLFCCFWVVFDFGNTLVGAIFNALITDVVPTPFLGRFFAMFRAVSLGCAFLFNYFLMGHAESYGTYIFAGLGILYGAGLFTICLKVKEGEYPDPAPDDDGPPTLKGAVKTYFRECFAIPYYRWVIAAMVISGFSVFGINMFAIYYAQSVELEMDLFGKLSAYYCGISFFLSFFLGWFSDRFHPIRTGMFSLTILTVILFWGGLYATDARGFSIVYFVENLAIMSFNTLMASYAPRLFPKAYFAQFNSAIMLLNAVGSVLLAPLFGEFLDLTGNYYPYVFTVGGFFGIAGLFCFVMTYRGYKRYGGDAGYIAPDPTRRAPEQSIS